MEETLAEDVPHFEQFTSKDDNVLDESVNSKENNVEEEQEVWSHVPTDAEILAQNLLKEELGLLHDNRMEFHQFPASMYGHTEDGTPADALTQLMRRLESSLVEYTVH
uniref:Uncharacterized protein n=1 Tax=Cacopsylla melanoneura TaxID=428564 RepID=A0A8D8ZGE8_9HEMI